MTTTNTNPNAAGLKDTFESIVIALILAFVFRCFVVEAFVIPTGSMATTLLGAHMRFQCEDCGYEFTANYSGGVRGVGDPVTPSKAMLAMQGTTKQTDAVFKIICPNCGYQVPSIMKDNPTNDATSPPVHYGDRILVLKYAYIANDPARWDVVVFKSPADQGVTSERVAGAPTFQQNFIKRLIGLPGEQIMVLDGDVYIRNREGEPWTVQTKPGHVQRALWRIICDQDYQPRKLPRISGGDYVSPWTSTGAGGEAGFVEQDHARTLSFDGKGGAATLAFNPDANNRRFPLTDWMTFDSTFMQQYMQNQYHPDTSDSREDKNNFNVVSDLQLRLTYQHKSGEGPLELNLTKLNHRFTARFLPQAVALIHHTPDGKEETVGTAPLAVGVAAQPMAVEFENVDYRVAVRVNGTELLSTTPAQYSPDVAGLLKAYNDRQTLPQPEVFITAATQSCTISHLSLWHDVYYINRVPSSSNAALHWALPDSPMVLGPKEFFVMGDNAQLSADARFWQVPVNLQTYEDLYADSGRVPERFMLGKAFFVYWPAGHRPTENSPGFIPNFGKMRMIH